VRTPARPPMCRGGRLFDPAAIAPNLDPQAGPPATGAWAVPLKFDWTSLSPLWPGWGGPQVRWVAGAGRRSTSRAGRGEGADRAVAVVNFNVRVTDELAARFDAWAAGRGGRSPALRRLIETACPPAPSALGDGPLGPRPVRLTVRLTARDAVGSRRSTRRANTQGGRREMLEIAGPGRRGPFMTTWTVSAQAGLLRFRGKGPSRDRPRWPFTQLCAPAVPRPPAPSVFGVRRGRAGSARLRSSRRCGP
jgi:hypothetical protein